MIKLSDADRISSMLEFANQKGSFLGEGVERQLDVLHTILELRNLKPVVDLVPKLTEILNEVENVGNKAEEISRMANITTNGKLADEINVSLLKIKMAVGLLRGN